MAELIAKTAAEGLLPLTIGRMTLAEPDWQPITSIATLSGYGGPALPEPGRSGTLQEAPVIWTGRNQWFVIGDVDLPAGLAVTDQSDAWCRVVLSGADVEAVLARLTPLDTNPAVFKPGRVSRTLVGHMNAILWRRSRDTVEIFAFRSMAKTLVHELERAMRGVVARAAL